MYWIVKINLDNSLRLFTLLNKNFNLHRQTRLRVYLDSVSLRCSMSKKNSVKKAVNSGVETKDSSPFVWQRDKLREPLEIHLRYNLSEKQRQFVDAALSKETRLVICDGLWGSAKTFLSVYCALELLSQKKVDSILYLRAPIEAGKGIGFLSGDQSSKINPYAEPLFQKLYELIDIESVKMLEKDKRIEVLPPGFIRGQSWNCKAIIVDEAANFDRAMLELILSRIGPFCKVFIIGSHHQSDIHDANGFMDVLNTFNDEESRQNGVYTFEFNDESDIVRSGFVKFAMRKLGVLPPKQV